MLCFLRGMAFVPFLLVTWSSAAFIISYVVAVLSGHVNPFLPYISDTGTTPPESGIFGFMINFSAFLGAATMYTRYKIVEKQNETCYFSTPVFNLVSLALGLVGCIGMGIVANFQNRELGTILPEEVDQTEHEKGLLDSPTQLVESNAIFCSTNNHVL